MKRMLVAAVLAVLVVPAQVLAQSHEMNSRKSDLALSAPLVVGDVTVAPGEYKIQCRKIEGTDYLVVTSVESGKEVARVPCTPESLSEKLGMSEIRTIRRSDGARVLTAVRIKGETIAHRVAN